MAGSSAPGAPFSVLIVCAPDDGPSMGALTQRLRADGLSPSLAPEAATPRQLREALRGAQAVIVCLSRRAMPNGRLAPSLNNVLEMLALAPEPHRLTLVLRLTSCELPASLRSAPAFDLFSASGYERLLVQLRAYAAAVAPAPEPEPASPPPPSQPSIPALALRGAFSLPQLERQGQVRRLGRGVARAIFLAGNRHALVVSGGGPTLIDLDDGQPLWTIDCPARCAALSPSGRLLALASGAQIFLWDLADGSLWGVCAGHADTVSGLAFAPDGRTLASSSHDRSVRLWRTGDDGRPPALLATLPDAGDQVASVAFSPDGTLLAAGGVDRTVRVWRTLDRSRAQILAGHGGAVEALAFSPDGALLATGAADHRVRLWRRADGTLLHTLARHAGPITSVAFAPDGATLASVAEDERLFTWRVADGAQLASLRPLSGRVTSLALDPQGLQLAIGGSSGSLAVYALEAEGGARLRQSEHRGAIVSAAFAGPAHLVTASDDKTVRNWSIASGTSSTILQTQGALYAACVAPGGRLLACSDGESTVQLWRLAGPTETPGGTFWRVLRGLRGRPRLITFGPRAEAVAVSSDDGGVRVWRIARLQGDDADPDLALTFEPGRARSLAFSADGALLAAGGDGGAVWIWGAADGIEVARLPGTGRATTSLAFAPDGRSLAAGDAGGGLMLWRLGAGEIRRRPPTVLLAHAGAVDHLGYSAGGRLVSGSSDGTVRVWRL